MLVQPVAICPQFGVSVLIGLREHPVERDDHRAVLLPHIARETGGGVLVWPRRVEALHEHEVLVIGIATGRWQWQFQFPGQPTVPGLQAGN